LEVSRMPVGRGLLKIDDYIGFGKLFESLEKLGAYMISYSPSKGKVYAWFRGKDALKAEQWLKNAGYKWKRKNGKLENFVMLAIDWGA